MTRKRSLWLRPSLLFIAVGALVGVSFVAIGSAAASDDSVLIAVVGDIQCGTDSPTGYNRCQSNRVRALIDAQKPDLVLMPGDLQYETGSVTDFTTEFGQTWGDLTSVLRPAPGNHEYRSDVAGYRGFFGEAFETGGQLHYGFDAGTWHGLSLDSNCNEIDCSSAGAQFAWASGQLAAGSAIDPAGCSIVEYHHPVMTSYAVDVDSEARFAETFAMLEAQGVDIVVAGHVHAYERFAPADDQLKATESGTVQFTVGTGGKSLYKPKGAPETQADFYTDSTYGVLFLRLYRSSYTFEFIDVDSNIVDAGQGTCR
jgi:hypothetical protein